MKENDKYILLFVLFMCIIIGLAVGWLMFIDTRYQTQYNINYNTWNEVDDGYITNKRVEDNHYIIQLNNNTEYVVGYNIEAYVNLEINDYVVLYVNLLGNLKVETNSTSYII